MTFERQQQIETLAIKLMGWTVNPETRCSETSRVCSEKACRNNYWTLHFGNCTAKYDIKYIEAIRRQVKDWNPFESPADCEMVKATLGEIGIGISVTREATSQYRIGPGHTTVDLYRDDEEKDDLEIVATGRSCNECKATGLAAYKFAEKLPECKEESHDAHTD